MKQTFSLNIHKPCSEKFSEFEPTNVGGFCNACQKEVIDFTQMSESEILAYFEKPNEKTCGRFRKSQLKVYSELSPSFPKRQRNYNLLGAGLFSFSLFSLLSINHSQAQNHSLATIKIPQKADNQAQNLDSKVDNDEHFVEGVVLDNGEPVPGVNIYLKGSNIGTVTDLDGKFKFPKLLKNGDILVFNSIGYETQELVISENTPENLRINVNISICTLTGEVSVNEVYASKPSFWQKLKGLFR